jgi:hypothetical protein
MQDRPNYSELLAAIEHFLHTEIVPNTEGARGFHARVAANAVRTVRRELEVEDDQLAREWAGLDSLLGLAAQPLGRAALREGIAARNAELCERIRRGEADSGAFGDQVRDHARRTVRAKLSVTNPDLLSRSDS